MRFLAKLRASCTYGARSRGTGVSGAVFEREDGKYGSRVKDAPEGATQGKHEAASPTPTN